MNWFYDASVHFVAATVWMLGVFGSIFTFALGVLVPNANLAAFELA
jgi:hypothetical protein